MHICTTKSLRAGLEIYAPKECPFCLHETLFYGYISMDCDTCGASMSGQFVGHTLRQIRSHAGWSRREYSKISGYAIQTIRNNEFNATSRFYLACFKTNVVKFYNNKEG
jgi:hypothetical protein